VTLARGAIGATYDAATGHLKTLAAPGGLNLAFAYDGALLTSESASGSVAGTVARTYDDDLRLASQSVNGTAVSFGYDADSLLTQAGALTVTRDAQHGLVTGSTLGGVTSAWTYDGFGGLATASASHASGPLYGAEYTRDKLGRIVQKRVTIAGTMEVTGYAYDPAGRLSGVTRDGVSVATYTYDANGNRLTVTAPSGTVSATYDAQDRLTQYGATTYTYTAAGELLAKTSAGQTTTYQYDELVNLIRVVLPDSTQIDYVVDGQNRRIGKKVNGTLVERLLYADGLRPIAELDGTGNVISRFVYSGGTTPAYLVKGGATYRIVTDHLGSPRLVVDASTGQVAQQLDYDTWGNVTRDTNPGLQPFGFAGGLYDQQTGLVRFGARDYDAASGRWTAKDPIGFAGGDLQLYGYVGSDPVNNSDPSGLLFGGFIDAGECYGQSAAMYWASQYNKDSGWAAAVDGLMGGLASLWTPATSDDTFTVLSTAAGSASLFRSAGREWSHWIPARFARGRPNGFLPSWIVASPLNGNYRSALTHAMNDPFRARFLGRAFMNSRLNPAWLRQWNRLPDWIKGLGMGTAAQASKGNANGCSCSN
jgi:RHS repeat-associated protein